jgi:hypothetical protein
MSSNVTKTERKNLVEILDLPTYTKSELIEAFVAYNRDFKDSMTWAEYKKSVLFL